MGEMLAKVLLTSWLERRREKRLRRKAEAAATEGQFQYEDTGMAINLGTRTSTNALLGGGALGQIYVALVQLIPAPAVVAALTTPEAVAVATAVFAWAVARISKTPAEPGLL
jgi:threonine dehydrogenase-like Zn-dependent dehydrogenase